MRPYPALNQTQKDPSSAFLSIGLMSGTSMDGIDAALLRTDGTYVIEELGAISFTYTPEFHLALKAAEHAAKSCLGETSRLSNEDFSSLFKHYLIQSLHVPEKEALETLHHVILSLKKDSSPFSFQDIVEQSTHLHSEAVALLLKKTGYPANAIDVIGYHGQTLFHKPSLKRTLQIGDGQRLSALTGITVVNDFRSRDVAAGGQGAPFAPLYHQALAIRDQTYPLAVVNCGGIANVTLIHGPTFDDVEGFDTGPGNGLIDLYVKRATSLKETMDKDGRYGLHGKVHEAVLKRLYEQALLVDDKNYFDLPAPKSLDINDLSLIPDLDVLSLEDACATLEAFTADSIVQSLRLIERPLPSYWVLAGGGWNNPVIKKELIQRVKACCGPNTLIETADEKGWHSKALEAQIFAYLAVRSLQGKPISLPKTTHVSSPLTGGEIHLPPQGANEKVKMLL
jgi:anhydro-N-acetylmuramic acid kinase